MATGHDGRMRGKEGPQQVGSSPTGGLDRVIGPEYTAVVHRVCSWCSVEFAREAWKRRKEKEITTWGICPSCRELREGAITDGERNGGPTAKDDAMR